MKLINQNDDVGCVYASMAMVSGLGIDEIEAGFKEHNDIPDLRGEMRQWVRMGYYPKIHLDNVYYHGNVYIVTAPSLNKEGVLHRLVVNAMSEEVEVLDPQNGREGKKFYKNLDDLKGWCELTTVENCFKSHPLSSHESQL